MFINRTSLIFLLCVVSETVAFAEMINLPIQKNANNDATELLPFSPLTPMTQQPPEQLATIQQSTPILANFIYLLATGVERGIDSIDRWTITANIEAGHIWDQHETLNQVREFVNDPGAQDSDQNPATPEYDRHATSVASIIAGYEPHGSQFGIAYNTELHSGALATKWNGKAYSGNFTTTPEAMATVYGAYFGFADVINSSWGGTDPTATEFPALITDGFANQHPETTLITSSGNLGPKANTVGGPSSGYNNITVGALRNNGANVYDSVASFSSRGPQDYSDPENGTVRGARAEIDLVAPGENLIVAHYGGKTGGNHPELPNNNLSGDANSYLFNVSGTSFAAPIVAGITATLIHAGRINAELAMNPYSRDARVIKSILLNSATKIPGWNNGQQLQNGKIVTSQALDWASGAGAVNSQQAQLQYILAETRDVLGFGGGSIKKSGWDYGEIGIGKKNVYQINEILAADSLFVATLSWFRDRSFNPKTLISQEIGHADLDLIIRDTITKKIVAESISVYNTVEHLYFTLPATSLYQIEINYNENLFGHLKKEEYGLAWFTNPQREAAEAKLIKPNDLHQFIVTHPHTNPKILPCGAKVITR